MLILVHEVLYQGNMGHITATELINISIKLGIVENNHVRVSCSLDEIKIYNALLKEFCDVFAWSYEEMLGIDPSIVVHEIPTYPNVKLVR